MSEEEDGFMEPAYYEEDEEEVDDDFDIGDEAEDSQKFESIVETYNAFFPNNKIISPYSGCLSFSIPSNFMPLGQRVVYGFANSDVLLKFTIELNNFEWNTKPTISFEHPTFQQRFVGRPLIVNLIERFFSGSYQPKKTYKSAVFLLSPNQSSDPKLLESLVKEGFNQKKSHKALVLCHGNVTAARAFLKTGELPDFSIPMPVSFSECPILYFVMEVCDIFLGLSDHCCFCGDKLKEPTVKPTVCDKQLCNVSFTRFGVGTSLLQEIRRDPDVADLMISCFATALGTQWLNPRPQGFTDEKMRAIINSLPRVNDMASADDDKDLVRIIGEDAVPLLNWILLSNKSQLTSLPLRLRLQQFPTRHQFLTLISNVDKEEKFKALKIKYGSKFLWHGSTGDRWHSIIRNGLKSATGTSMQQNGSVFGAGIYFAADLATSRNYSRSVANGYPKSMLGSTLQAVGLCEVAKVPELVDHTKSYTITREDAVIVRFLFLSANFEYDVVQNPPTHIPKLQDILNYHATQSK